MLLTLNDEETSSSICGVISGLDEFTSAYNYMPTKDLYSHFHFALNYITRLRRYNQKLREYSEEIDHGECKEVFCVEREKMKREYWEKGGDFKYNLSILNVKLKDDTIVLPLIQANGLSTFDEFTQSIEKGFNEFVFLLNGIRKKLVNAPTSIYGNYYQQQKARINKEDIISAYEDWKMNISKLTFASLKTKQTVLVADFLKKNVLRYANKPTKKELSQVRMDLIEDNIPWDYEIPNDFNIQCAKFRRFNSWKVEIIKLDYDCWGKYLFQHYNEMTDDERYAFIELDIMLELINQDLEGLEPETKEDLKVLLPELLATQRALIYWELLKKHKFVGSNYMLLPTTTRQQAMYIAEIFAEKLKLPSKWKLFENYWGIKNLAQEKNQFLEIGKSPARADVIDEIFKD